MGKVLIGNLRGPAGPTGPSGDPGATGPEGPPGSGVATNIITPTNSITLDGTETSVLINGNNLRVTLPNATLVSQPIFFKLIASFTTATIVTSHSQTIDGDFAEYQLETKGQWVTLQSDGSDWQSVNAKTGGALTVPFSTLPGGIIDQAYSIRLSAAGGWPGYIWSLKSGALPQGVSLTPDGAISGTLTASGSSTFVIQVADSVGTIFSLPLTITASPPPSGSDITLVNRGPVAKALIPNVTPAFGAATQAGNFLLAHIGANGSGPITTTADGWVMIGGTSGGAALAYKMNCDADETPPEFTGGSATDMHCYVEEWANVLLSGAFDRSVDSTGSGQSWNCIFPTADSEAGELLAASGYWNGSNLDGEITLTAFRDSLGNTVDAALIQDANAFGQYFAGTAAVLGATGSFTNEVGMNLSVFAGGHGIMASFKSVNAGPPGPPTVTTSSPLKTGNTEQPYRVSFGAQDGVPPYTWSLAEDSNPLPTGLSISTDGVISGTPTVAGTVSIDVQVSDSFSQLGTKVFSLPIDETPTVTFSTTAPQGTSQGYTVDSIIGCTRPVPVNNNVWSPVPGWQSALKVVDPTDWWLVANFPAGNTQVSSYSSLGCYFDEMDLSRFTNIVSTYDENMNANDGSQCWAAYDMWLNNWGNEVMLQHNLARFNTWENAPLARNITFGGNNGTDARAWDLHLYGTTEFVWHPANGSWDQEIGNVDILEIFQWMIDNGYLPATNTLTAIGYGWEICSTGGIDQFFKVNDFSLEADHT